MSLIEATLPQPRQEVAARPTRSAAQRFTFIDALRGLAALGVACYHIHRYGPLHEPASELIPVPLARLFEHGWMGVQVFFVISGFVIAYSVHGAPISLKFLGNFALRRSIRLDPPYWATIFIVLGLYGVARMMGTGEDLIDPPSWGQLFSHAFYMQDVLGYGNVSVGFWSLCIEVQFYLLLIVMLGLAQWLHHRLGAGSKTAGAYCLLVATAPLALFSLGEYHPGSALDMWIVHFFCMFFLGALGWWTLCGRVPRVVFWLYVALLVARLYYNFSIEIAGATVAGISIFLVGRAGHLSDWLSARFLQYLGRISYSLYLIHYPVSWIIVGLGFWLTGDNPYWAVFWLVLALGLSIAAADMMYRLVEAPSVRFAKRFKPATS